MRWLTLFLALTLGDCTGSLWGESEAQRQAEEAKNLFPAGYKSDLLAFMRTYLNDPTNIRTASVSPPELKTVGPYPRFVACVRYNAKGSNGQFAGMKDNLAVFILGKLDRLIELGNAAGGGGEAEGNKSLRDLCSAAAYQPFPELEHLAR
jgi:hypothetical protein